MTSRMWLHLAEIVVSVLIAITILVAWQADRRDRAQLATQLAAAQKTIADATASQHTRDAELTQTLSQIAKLKQSVVTPSQILNAIPGTLSLPAPITLNSARPGGSSSNKAAQPTEQPKIAQRGMKAVGTAKPTSAPAPNTAGAVVPEADLKPLYDFALDCKACQAKLATVQSDLNDEKVKTAALKKQRDDAVRAAKGGSALRRILHAAKWFILGAAAGALAAKAAH